MHQNTPSSSPPRQLVPRWEVASDELEDYACVMSVSEKPTRLRITTKDGVQTSIPYHTLTEINLLTPGCLVVKTCCGNLTQILINGRSLQPIFDGLEGGSLVWIKESSEPASDEGKTMVSTIELQRAE